MNKAVRLALKALSQADIEVSKTYKLERSVSSIKSPVTNVLYSKFDRAIKYGGREIMVRMYPAENTPSGLILYFHGGGWVKEAVDTYNGICKAFAQKTGFTVASVEYSLAPENKFPLPLEDCYAVTKHFLENGEFEKVILAGDSAGGNLAAAVSLLARDKGEKMATAQILIYPCLYNDHTENSPFSSIRENGEDYILTSKRICEYTSLYVDDKDRHSPYFAPLLTERFSDQPKTLVVTAEFDPLRDEGEEYAKRLSLAGVASECYRIKDAVHGFLSLPATFPSVVAFYNKLIEFTRGI